MVLPTNIDIVAVISGITVLTEAFKLAPKIPVNSGNAVVVAFVLAVILAIGPALLSGSLATQDATVIAQSIAIYFGGATILYEAVKRTWVGLLKLIKK